MLLNAFLKSTEYTCAFPLHFEIISYNSCTLHIYTYYTLQYTYSMGFLVNAMVVTKIPCPLEFTVNPNTVLCSLVDIPQNDEEAYQPDWNNLTNLKSNL